MASERLTAVFDAVDNISKTLQGIDTSVEDLGQSVDGLSNDFEENMLSSRGLEQAQESLSNAVDDVDRSFSGLEVKMSEHVLSSRAVISASEEVGSTIDDLEGEVDEARRSFESLNIVQGMTTAQAATNAGAMEIAGNAIDEMGDDALKTAGQMGVLNTVMEELSLSGSALSINIGAFNVSLRNLAPLVPIAASMGSVVTVMGAFISSLGAATVALGAFTAAGALGFLEDMQAEFDGLTDRAETLEAVMSGIKDLFIEALEPLRSAENTQLFINLIEGSADFVNRLAQAISQMRDTFMPLFSGFADIINSEFDNVANGIEDMMEHMNPVLLTTFEWFMQKLPDALRFMGRVTDDLVRPIGNLGDSLIDLLTSIIETAVQIIQGLAPAFSVALDVATELIDIFSVLSNGFLQATLFLGGLTLAATKFVGIADTIANVGISAANTFSQWAGQIRNIGGILPRLNQALSNQFEHLKALGSVLTGNMSIQQASGQVQEDFKDEVQEFARALLEAENGSEQLRNKLIQLQKVMDDDVVEEPKENLHDFQDELEDTGDKVDDKMDDVANATAEGMGSASDEIAEASDTVSGMDFGTDEAQAEIDDLIGKSGGVDGLVESMDEVVDEITEIGESSDEVTESVSELGEKLGPEMASASDEVVEASDNIVEGIEGISRSGGQLQFFGEDGFTNAIEQSDELNKALDGIEFNKVDTSEMDVDNVTDLRNSLIKSSDNADELADGVDNVTQALSEGPLSAGPSEPLITNEALETVGGLSDEAASASDEAMELGDSLDAVDEAAMNIAIPDRLDGAEQQAAEAADRMKDTLDSTDFSGVFEEFDKVDNADKLADGVDNVTQALSKGPLSAGPSEPLITNEALETVGGLSDEAASASDEAMELGDSLDAVNEAAMNIAIPDRLGGAEQQAAEAADRMKDTLNSADFSGVFEEFDKVDNADELADGVDNVTQALSEGPLSAGPSEPLITNEALETVGGLSDEAASASDEAMELGDSLDAVDKAAMNIAIPDRLDGAEQQAAEAADRMKDTLDSTDFSGVFEEWDITEGAEIINADMPDFSDAADDMSTFNKEFETAMDFDVPFDDVHLEQPWERADAAVQSFDDDMLAMADSADELDLSETMDPIDTSNLDAVKGKLGGLRDSAQNFGKRTSDALRGVGQSVSDFATGAGEDIGGAADSIKDGLGTIKGAAVEQAKVLKRSFVQAGGASGILSSAVTKAKTRLGALKTAVFNAAGSLRIMARSALDSVKALAVQAATAARTALRNWYLAFSQGGVVAGFKAMASSAYGAVAGLAAAAAGAISTAASFVAGLIPATLSAGLALNTAFSGIPALLGALIALSAIAVGILGNMDGVTSSLKGAFDGLKSAISQIGDALLSVGVSAWNLFIDIMEAVLSPVFAIVDGFKLIGEALGIAGGEGGFLMGIIGGLLDGFSALMNIIGAMFDFVAPAFNFIGDLIYSAFIIPFQILAKGISVAFELLQGLVALAIEKIPFMSELVGGLQSAFEMVKNAIAEIPAFFDTVASMIGGTIDEIVGGIKSALEPAVNFINGLIDQANKIPEVDIEKVSIGGFGGGGASEALSVAQTSADEVRDNVRSSEEEPDDDVATQPDVDMSLEDSVENNVEVQADPEDKAQLSRITKDALEEANSFARRQQGGQ